jgi:hypothetical protein
MPFPKKKTAPVPPVPPVAPVKKKGAAKKPAAKPAPQPQWAGIANQMLAAKKPGPGAC